MMRGGILYNSGKEFAQHCMKTRLHFNSLSSKFKPFEEINIFLRTRESQGNNFVTASFLSANPTRKIWLEWLYLASIEYGGSGVHFFNCL